MFWWKKYRLEIVVLACGFALIHLFLFAKTYQGDALNAEKAAQFGDFIGGYIGSIFGLVSVVLLVLTLREQTRQREEDGVERRFFQLLDYHRQNVSDIGIRDKMGHRTFVTLIREFRLTLDQVKEICVTSKVPLDLSEMLNLAYMTFYYGTGPNSTRVLAASLRQFDKNLVQKLIQRLDDVDVKKQAQKDRKLSYTPFEGHQSRLGHYFRHLYQMVCYIDGHAKQRANEYADLLRAQLSNHEQAILCLNSLSTIGAAWNEKGLIEKYQLIKNIPKDFFNPKAELNVENRFPYVRFEFAKHYPSDPNRDIA